MKKTDKKPNPGSEEAIKQGCTCAIMDNHHGAGFPYGGGICFWTTEDCPLHGDNQKLEKEQKTL